jgi:hypothetical protein
VPGYRPFWRADGGDCIPRRRRLMAVGRPDPRYARFGAQTALFRMLEPFAVSDGRPAISRSET